MTQHQNHTEHRTMLGASAVPGSLPATLEVVGSGALGTLPSHLRVNVCGEPAMVLDTTDEDSRQAVIRFAKDLLIMVGEKL